MEGRDFKSEIDAAQNDPVRLRKIADDIHASGGSRILLIRAIQLARAAIGRAPLCTPVPNAQLVCRLLLAKKHQNAPAELCLISRTYDTNPFKRSSQTA